ncbi:MAG: HepT-like ribonuclease domain-containing protein [Armatimonadota bacterium]|nr:HepT-like ribonuclease domain-containing protein [Armatimonadota bacterium]
MTERDPVVYLLHMRDLTEEALELCAGRERADLERDRLFGLAMTRLVEVIGEAATKLPAEVHDRYPDIPWRKIIGMRNRLIHGYEYVDYDVLWETITTSLSELLPPLTAAISDMGAAEQE